MCLIQRLSALATRLGVEVKAKVDASHPGLARVWVCFGTVDGQVVVRSAHHVAGVTRLDKGRYRVAFASPLPDANYCWTALARSNTDSGLQRQVVVRATAELKTTQFVDLTCASGTASFEDSPEINLVVYR